ncbi:hypothetical protein KUTeg_007799 [Tegillarca granosa]|uniref:Uncharacterized protein n=1 Tax=Tegillarca granosa TaxID=220873 RepID=A0ABQ9FEC6_TEGGR|nr:hypothetical protein KUTeg_007799 [Tegillarca granosa]
MIRLRINRLPRQQCNISLVDVSNKVEMGFEPRTVSLQDMKIITGATLKIVYIYAIHLRTQAETELRALRAELMQKKIHLSLQRHQQTTAFSSPAPPQSDMLTYRQPMITPRS